MSSFLEFLVICLIMIGYPLVWNFSYFQVLFRDPNEGVGMTEADW